MRMKPFHIFVFLSSLVNFGNGLDNLRIRIESSTFEPCSHIKNGRLISNNSRIDFSQGQYNLQKYGVARLSHFQLIDRRGNAKDLTLPGCFNVRIDATFTQTIENPYVEAFIKSDRDELCQKFKPNPYCPATDNPSARLLTQNQNTCRFCDLCVSAEELAKEMGKGENSDVVIRASNSACSDNERRIQAGQSYPIEITNICSPTTNDIEKELDQKFGTGWHDVDFVRRGSVVLTIHMLDRKNAAPKPCLELGAGTYKWRGPSVLEGRVRENLENTCKHYRDPTQDADKPKDDYLGCYNGYINYAIDRL